MDLFFLEFFFNLFIMFFGILLILDQVKVGVFYVKASLLNEYLVKDCHTIYNLKQKIVSECFTTFPHQLSWTGLVRVRLPWTGLVFILTEELGSIPGPSNGSDSGDHCMQATKERRRRWIHADFETHGQQRCSKSQAEGTSEPTKWIKNQRCLPYPLMPNFINFNHHI